MKSFKNDFEELKKIPRTSGLYYFYDKSDNILYIGKAKILHSRILDHHFLYLLHREGMFFRKIIISKGWLGKDRKEWDKKCKESFEDFLFNAESSKTPLVIDLIFGKVKRVEIEEMSHELTKSKEKELILKLKPPFNRETASDEYYIVQDELE